MSSIAILGAAEHHGHVKFNGLPVPGATITAAQGDRRAVALSDMQGAYSFPDLANGVWSIKVDMLCFAPLKADLTIGPESTAAHDWDLKLLPMAELKAATVAAPPKVDASFERAELKRAAALDAAPPPQEAEPQADPELSQRAADGFLINGTTNNGAASPFAMMPAFGNSRQRPGSLYNGGIGILFDSSAFDARSFSLTGQDTAKPAYNHLTGTLSFGGPLKIPRLLPKGGPNIVLNYQWMRNSTVTTQPGLMPTNAERLGDFSQSPRLVIDPSSGVPFPGNVIPQDRISPQARALLTLYPLPNFEGSKRYNYQLPLLNGTHQDSLQTRLDQTINRKNQISGNFALQSTRSDSPTLFGFLDDTDSLGLTATLRWRHNFTTRLFATVGFQYSRLATRVVPYFENRMNVSGVAGIQGNDQSPLNWGPPTLSFSSGIAQLTDVQQSFTRDQTNALSYAGFWSHNRHNVFFGADARRQQFNLLSQQDARGAFTFTGAAAGSDLAGFLLGVPDTSSIAFGNADKYFRAWSDDAYFTDDWRVHPGLTVNTGVRWEYGSPITEKYGRLVNLAVAPGFTSVTPVIASLLHPDRHAFEPRIGVSWRPFPASSMLLRAGYGVYYNTAVYLGIATQMAQQSPLSKSVLVQNSPDHPLTLADGLNAVNASTPNTFGVDPNFRVGYSQNWQLSVQRDLPGALVFTATYLGSKGTRAVQMFLPNTYPAGARNPCPTCPNGFAYMTSNGNSTLESGQAQLRRRLHSGLTATLQYTYSKAIDDAALGGKGQGVAVIAQNWLDLSAERSRSNFDQRHLLSVQAQYTTGMGMMGGTLVNGWRGSLLKEWSFTTQITAGSGLPLTPLYPVAVNGTGFTGPVRPDYTGASVYAAPLGLFLNPLAYVAPANAQWGNAGRNSITGPGQFTFNASIGRTFRLGDRLNMDFRIDATNAINHVTYPSWNTTLGSAQFGLPSIANAMRSVQTTFRMRF